MGNVFAGISAEVDDFGGALAVRDDQVDGGVVGGGDGVEAMRWTSVETLDPTGLLELTPRVVEGDIDTRDR